MTALQRHEDRSVPVCPCPYTTLSDQYKHAALYSVRRFESLLRPFASSPTEGGPASSSKNNHSARPDVGELPPAHGRGPRSAEAWRKEELRKLCSDGALSVAAQKRLLATPTLID